MEGSTSCGTPALYGAGGKESGPGNSAGAPMSRTGEASRRGGLGPSWSCFLAGLRQDLSPTQPQFLHL